MNAIAKTAFHTSLLSYVLFLLADYVRPGFVSYVFSVHWFLLAAVVTGILWAGRSFEQKEERLFATAWRWCWQLFFGCVLAMLVWQNGDVFGDLRIFITLVGFLIPWMVMRALQSIEVRK